MNSKMKIKELKRNTVDAVVHESEKILAFDQSIVILYLMKFTGLLPFHGGGRQMAFRVWRLSFLYTMTIYLAVVFLTTKMLSTILATSMIHHDCDFNCQAFLFVTILLALLAFVIPIFFWSRIPDIIDYYQLWFQFQEKFRLYSISLVFESRDSTTLILEKLSCKLIYTIILASFALSLALSGFGYGLDFYAEVFVGYFVICFFINVATSFWCNQCRMVRAGIENIRQFFTQLVQTDSLDSSLTSLSICYELWLSFYPVLKLLFKSQAFLLSLLTSGLFLSSIVTVYSFISQILSDVEFHVDAAAVNFVLSVWSLTLLYLLNDSAFEVTKQADLRNWVISVNLNAMCTDEMQDEILELLSFFENQVPGVGLFEFAFLSRNFIIALSSTLITYIVIILQFRSTKKQAAYAAKCNSSV